MVNHNKQFDNNDENCSHTMMSDHSPFLRGQDSMSVFMENMVAAAQNDAVADRRLAEEIHRQQLEERIQQIQAQLHQLQQTQQQKQPQRRTVETLDDEKRFFGAHKRRNSSTPEIQSSKEPENGDEPVNDNDVPTAPPPLEEQDSVVLLNKVVAMRAAQQPQQPRPEGPLLNDREEEPNDQTEPPQQPLTLSTPHRIFPGAVRVGGSQRHLGLDKGSSHTITTGSQHQSSRSILQAVETDMEQARTRQEVLLELPQAAVVLTTATRSKNQDMEHDVNPNDFENHNSSKSTTYRCFIRLSILLLAACMVVILILLLRTKKSEGPNSKTTTTAMTMTFAPSSAPILSAACPCDYAESDSDDGQPVACGNVFDLQDILGESDIGLGLCSGGACAAVIPDVERVNFDGHACFVATGGPWSMLVPPRQIESDAQLQSCEALLLQKCLGVWTP